MTHQEPLLDEAVVHRLVRDVGEVTVRRAVAAFGVQVGERIVAIQTAAGRGDAARCREEAHAIRSSAGMLGAVALLGAATRLEMECRITGVVPPGAAALDALFRETLGALAGLLAEE